MFRRYPWASASRADHTDALLEGAARAKTAGQGPEKQTDGTSHVLVNLAHSEWLWRGGAGWGGASRALEATSVHLLQECGRLRDPRSG
eukprot:658084-Pyramimonas_sp.AAC.1